MSEKTIQVPDLSFEPLAPLWRAAAEGELKLPRCQQCGKFDWYPKGVCAGCGGGDIVWTKLSGRAKLFSWAVVKRALHLPIAPLGPYVSAIVAIEEDPNVRIVTRVVDCDPEGLQDGMELEVKFADLGYPGVQTNVTAPLFAPAQKQ